MEGGSQPESRWVRSSDWELNNPVAGNLLTGEGIRVIGHVEHPPYPTEGISLGRAVHDGEWHSEYGVTGSVVSGNAWDDRVDVVFSVNGEMIQTWVSALAGELKPGSLLTVRGQLELIADYEWDAFNLVDTRGSWAVEDVRDLAAGDYALLLRPTS